MENSKTNMRCADCKHYEDDPLGMGFGHCGLKDELALAFDRLCDDGERKDDESIEHAPTIDAVPHWIPCEERLPEEEGWYLVTIQNDKTEKRRTENDLFAIGIAEAHKLTPYKFCKDGYRQTVIAWMPLPEPYVGERKNDD